MPRLEDLSCLSKLRAMRLSTESSARHSQRDGEDSDRQPHPFYAG